jgi:HPt (histidine-containing phosphotransfer) domain-containing protein
MAIFCKPLPLKNKPMSEPSNPQHHSYADSPLDDSVLLEYLGDDDGLRREVLQQFINTLVTDLQQLQSEVQARNIGAVQRSAHRLKGACYMVGARPLGDRAMNLEQLARTGNDADFEAALAALIAEHHLVLKHLAVQNLKPQLS